METNDIGRDHRPDGLGSQLFSAKSAHAKKAAAVNGGNIKVVSIYNGLFIDSSFVVRLILTVLWPGTDLVHFV